MEKVSGNVGYPVAAFNAASEQNTRLWDRSSGVVGHSSINRAIDAHRMQVDERNTRTTRHSGVTVLSDDQGFDPNYAMTGSNSSGTGQQTSSSDDMIYFQNQMLEPAASQAKAVSIESFRSIDHERPTVGEPVPKGSYLDVAV